ncbi:hypothetical protein RHECNPAF_9300131 [Rhizobium etli CNPAF512]|nr:hypothetical protein RHECNPAF_9300131 [Rhizobium etli CNPAF512]
MRLLEDRFRHHLARRFAGIAKVGACDRATSRISWRATPISARSRSDSHCSASSVSRRCHQLKMTGARKAASFVNKLGAKRSENSVCRSSNVITYVQVVLR